MKNVYEVIRKLRGISVKMHYCLRFLANRWTYTIQFELNDGFQRRKQIHSFIEK